uniref:Uncharacterized protein n=1 Tax=Anguilla anguilla TaxID=7936 RepID=A0A0E9PJ29_ANGAN
MNKLKYFFKTHMKSLCYTLCVHSVF